jgi:hypothetical protein
MRTPCVCSYDHNHAAPGQDHIDTSHYNNFVTMIRWYYTVKWRERRELIDHEIHHKADDHNWSKAGQCSSLP